MDFRLFILMVIENYAGLHILHIYYDYFISNKKIREKKKALARFTPYFSLFYYLINKFFSLLQCTFFSSISSNINNACNSVASFFSIFKMKN